MTYKTHGLFLAALFLALISTPVSVEAPGSESAQNPPISSISPKGTLARALVDNLLLSVRNPPLHETDKICDATNSETDLFRDTFLAVAMRLRDPALEALLGGQKRVVHIVDKLWITFSVGNLSPPRSISVIRPIQRFQHPVLRC